MEWLLLLEIKELLPTNSTQYSQVDNLLEQIKTKDTSLVDLIDAGRALLSATSVEDK